MITTHVLDTALGRPAAGVQVLLELQVADGWVRLGSGATDGDGRLRDLPVDADRRAGIYRLTFDTGGYFSSCGEAGFYPSVAVEFEVADPTSHHHVPLLLSPYGYSTYRGS